MLMAFCPPLGMVGNVFAWSSPVKQLAALDVVLVFLVFPCPPYMLITIAARRCFSDIDAERRKNLPVSSF
jgi:hypothetical protein